MTLPPLATRQEESTMAEILVEKLGVPALYLANKVTIINVAEYRLDFLTYARL